MFSIGQFPLYLLNIITFMNKHRNLPSTDFSAPAPDTDDSLASVSDTGHSHACVSKRCCTNVILLVALFHTPTHNHKTQTRTLVNLQRTKTSFGQKAFSFVRASMWRSLPKSVREASSLHEFTSLARNIILIL